MKHFIRLLGVISGFALAACSGSPQAPEASATTPAATTERSTPQEITQENQGILTDAQAAGLNAANQLSNALEDAEKERRRQLDETTR